MLELKWIPPCPAHSALPSVTAGPSCQLQRPMSRLLLPAPEATRAQSHELADGLTARQGQLGLGPGSWVSGSVTQGAGRKCKGREIE